jgi:hypothetical protein
MMPVALGFLWLELKFLERLFVPVAEDGPVPFFLPTSPAPPRTPPLTPPTSHARIELSPTPSAPEQESDATPCSACCAGAPATQV